MHAGDCGQLLLESANNFVVGRHFLNNSGIPGQLVSCFRALNEDFMT
jgi:hypothetical protein